MVHEPRGVVALLVPWNDPVAIACGQIAAALVTGNAVVFKPSEKTPLSGVRLVELLDLPAASCSSSSATPAPAARSSRTGSSTSSSTPGPSRRGARCARACADRLGKALLELGGKDAMVVDDGVDPEWAAEQAAIGAFANAGQICTSVERIYVHRAVAEPFTDALVRAGGAPAGRPGADPGTEMGPLIDAGRREWVHRHVEDAVQRGAELRAGGRSGRAGLLLPADGPRRPARRRAGAHGGDVRARGRRARRSTRSPRASGRRTGASTAWPPWC